MQGRATRGKSGHRSTLSRPQSTTSISLLAWLRDVIPRGYFFLEKKKRRHQQSLNWHFFSVARHPPQGIPDAAAAAYAYNMPSACLRVDFSAYRDGVAGRAILHVFHLGEGEEGHDQRKEQRHARRDERLPNQRGEHRVDLGRFYGAPRHHPEVLHQGVHERAHLCVQ